MTILNTAQVSRRRLLAGTAALGVSGAAVAATAQASPVVRTTAGAPSATSPAPAPSLRERLRKGEVTYGIGVTIPSPAVTQLLARAGFDWLFVDLEHGPISVETAHAMIAATAGTPVATMVRLPQTLNWLAKPLLDAGAAGIVFPNVNDTASAQIAARATRYPPDGDRMWGPFYAPARFGQTMPDYLAGANESVVSVVIIEDPTAVESIADIVQVPGIDAAVIGTHDLAVSIGRPGQPDHPDVQSLVARAERAIAASDVALGGNAFSPEQAKVMADRGYRMIALGFDWVLLQRGAAAVLPPRETNG